MLIIKNPTFGSDFEVCVSQKNKIIPALMVPGTKKKPAYIGNRCYIQRDGPNAEFNIPPVKTKKDWTKYFNYCFKKGNELLAQHQSSLVIKSSNTFTNKELDQEDLRELFCEPSLDAYDSGYPRHGEITNETYNFRTAGLHIHVGFIVDNIPKDKIYHNIIDDLCLLSYYFDLYLAIPSIFMDRDTDRRKLYGMPGDFRYKVIDDLVIYEYRSLGIGTIENNNNIDWIYDQTNKTINKFNERINLPDLNRLKNCIINSNLTEAKKLISEFNL